MNCHQESRGRFLGEPETGIQLHCSLTGASCAAGVEPGQEKLSLPTQCPEDSLLPSLLRASDCGPQLLTALPLGPGTGGLSSHTTPRPGLM